MSIWRKSTQSGAFSFAFSAGYNQLFNLPMDCYYWKDKLSVYPVFFEQKEK